MDDDLPSEFDLVVIGTGFSESVVAAAASRVGKTVLHIDPNDFYGGLWSSFNLDAFEKFIENCKEGKFDPNYSLKSTKQYWLNKEKCDEGIKDNEWTKEKIHKSFRQFNIDLSPKLLFNGGKLVELLISSNICRYAEFRAVDNVCTVINGELKVVPCSRNDVFNTQNLSIVEKRLIMKLLTNCMNYDENPEEFANFEGKTFLEYLKANKLTDNIIHYVMHAISMSNEDSSLKEGIANTKKFLQSLGKYGNTPFLFPMYGCGEIPQCFCRLCAVFGGVYCLKRQVESIHVDEKEVLSIKCRNQEIKIKNLVISGEHIPEQFIKDQSFTKGNTMCGGLARAIFITSSFIGNNEVNSGGGGVNFLHLPCENKSNGAFVIQLSHYSLTCPKGLYLIHITAESITKDAENDLKPYVDVLFNKTISSEILYSTYFTVEKCKKCSNSLVDILPINLHFTCGPYYELDYDLSIKNAQEIFFKMYPDEIFLPRAPDPEEIIFDDVNSTTVE